MLPVGMTTTSICFFLVDMCRSILNMRALGGFFFFRFLVKQFYLIGRA